MNESSFLGLIHNVTLLLALALLFDRIAVNWQKRNSALQQLLVGFVIGGIGIVVMLTPWVLIPGIIFDTRSVLLSISGLFFGTVPTLIAMGMTVAFRIYQGGIGTLMGVCVILATGAIGIVWRRLRRRSIVEISGRELYLFGIVIHLVMLAFVLTLPRVNVLEVFTSITLPVLVIYPIGTALLGFLMVGRLRREFSSAALKESQERLRLAVEASNIGFFDRDLVTNEVHFSQEWKNQIGFEVDEITNDQEEWQSRVHPEDLPKVLERLNATMQGLLPGYEAEYRLRHKDGSYRWILARGSLQYDARGKPVRLLGSHVDITRHKEDERAILASERRFRGLAESSQDTILLYDRENRLVYENPAALRVSGLTEEDRIGKTHLDAEFGEGQSADLKADIQQVFTSGTSSQRLFEWDSAKGKVFLDWRLSPVFAPDGAVEMVLGISRDITALKQAEQNLQKSEEKFRVLTENIKDVVWILDAETMYFRYVSPSVERLRGYTPEEILSVPVDHALLPEAREYYLGLIRSRTQAFRTGKEQGDKFYTEEVEQSCKNGSTVWTEVVTAFYLNTETNHIEVRGVTRDISERKRSEEVIRKSEENYRLLFEQASDGIVIIDGNGYLADTNSSGCALLGYGRDELRQLNILDLVIDKNQDETPFRSNDLGIAKKMIGERKMRHKDGTIIDVEISGRMLSDGRFMGMVRDIMPRKRVEEEVRAAQAELQRMFLEADRSREVLLSLVEDQKLAEERIRHLNVELEQRVQDRTAQLLNANKELEAFAYSVSHDLRAPLRAMDGFSSALLEGYPDRLDEKGKHYLERIREASRRMGQLINDLLSLSRVTRTEFNRQRVDLSKLAGEIGADLKAQDPQRAVIFDISPDLIVQGDTHLLRIALENLINNAYKFTGQRELAQIEVGLVEQGGKRVFFVRDNGVGFNMDYAEKLFAPFQRLHSMNEFPGTGIGLVTVQRIVHRHGGRIWPEAVVDQGATFYFTLGGD